MRKILLPLILFSGLLPSSMALAGTFGPDFSDLIPAERRIDWSKAGLSFADGSQEIPAREKICASFHSDATAAQINAAIQSCDNGTVFLNEGVYTLTAISFGGKSNVTVRGAGPDKTILHFTSNDDCSGAHSAVCLGGHMPFWTGNIQILYPQYIHDWTDGYSKGSTVITLSNAGTLKPGDLLVLDQVIDSVDDGGFFVNDVQGVGSIEGTAPGRLEPGGPRPQQQYVKVTSVNASNGQVGIFPGIELPNWRASQQPQAWFIPVSSSNGIENMTLDHTGGVAQTGIGLSAVYNCWVKNVKSLNADRNHVDIMQSARCVVRDSYFYGTLHGQSQSYGVESFGSSDNLIVNNIFQHVTTPIMTGTETGSVIAYNFMTDMYFFNWSGMDNNFMQPGINMGHDSGAAMNLFEGNMTNGLQIDLFHGTSGLETALRNEVTGYETFQDKNTGVTTVKNATVAVQIGARNRLVNMIGNILGKLGFHTKYEDSLVPPGTSGDFAHSIYYLGQASCCEQTNYGTVTYDPGTVTTMLRWGNFDYVTQQTQWNPAELPTGVGPLTKTIPKSFWVADRPSWWYSSFGTPPWPPIGPDQSPMVNAVPARLCYDHLSKDTNGILMFDPIACYQSGGKPGQPTPTPTPTSTTSNSSPVDSVSLNVGTGKFNPKAETLLVSFHLPTDDHVVLKIFDRFGREPIPAVSVDGKAGDNATSWDGKNRSGGLVASGVYTVELKTSSTTLRKKVAVIK